jgi:CubicO group peptidase (beta-lactamase class C family)
MLRLFRCVFGVLLLAGAAAHAAELVPRAQKKLDAYFDLLQQRGLASGSIAISERGVRRYERSIGFATIDNGVPQPADAGTRYRIGAVSHLFVAALTMQLAESATLTLDYRIAEFFPEYPGALQTSYRDLLRESGGAADDANYQLLARVLEKIDERPIDEILQRRIARKLGLARTYVAGSGTASSLESASYEWRDGWQAVPRVDEPVAILSNAGDLTAFMDALVGAKLVTSYSRDVMIEQERGLHALEIHGHHCNGARGHADAFDSVVCHFPDSRITVAWTGNATRLPVDQILDEAMRLVFEKARRPPKSITAE